MQECPGQPGVGNESTHPSCGLGRTHEGLSAFLAGREHGEVTGRESIACFDLPTIFDFLGVFFGFW